MTFLCGGKEEARQQQISPLRYEMTNKRTGNSRSFDFAQDDIVLGCRRQVGLRPRQFAGILDVEGVEVILLSEFVEFGVFWRRRVDTRAW
jgi:hypothetical protein